MHTLLTEKWIRCDVNYATFNAKWQRENVQVPLCIKVLEIDWTMQVGDYDYCIVGYANPKIKDNAEATIKSFSQYSDVEEAETLWNWFKNDIPLNLYGRAIFRKNIKTGIVQNYVNLEFDDGDCSYPVESDIEQFVHDIFVYDVKNNFVYEIKNN